MPLEIKGIGLNRFCAIGKLHFYNRSQPYHSAVVTEKFDGDSTLELSRLEIAVSLLSEHYMQKESENKKLFNASLIEEAFENEKDCLTDKARENIFRGQKAHEAIKNAAAERSREIAGGGDPFLVPAASSILYLGDRLAALIISDYEAEAPTNEKYHSKPVILIAEEISPDDILQIHREMLIGIFLFGASPLSKKALLAHSFGIPVIVSPESISDLAKELEGKNAIIDGEKGLLIIDPEGEMVEHYGGRLAELAAPKSTEKMLSLNVTADIGDELELENSLFENGFEIGLFRVKRALRKKDPESEAHLFSLLSSALEASKGKKAFVELDRKNLPIGNLIKAALRAAEKGKLTLLLRGVLSVTDIRGVLGELTAIQNEDAEKSTSIKNLSIGAIIDNCAAVMMCDEIAKSCDHILIDSDELLASLLFPLPRDSISKETISTNLECLMRAIKKVTDAAHNAEIKVGVCGMLITSRRVRSKLADHGIDEIIVPPPYIGFV